MFANNKLDQTIESLRFKLKNHELKDAFELAENLFILSRCPHFWNISLYCKKLCQIDYKDMHYIISVCQNHSLREYLYAILYISEKKLKPALESLRNSIKYHLDPPEEMLIFRIKTKSRSIHFLEELTTIPDAAERTLNALGNISKLNSYEYYYKLNDVYFPAINNQGEIEMKKALAREIAISHDPEPAQKDQVDYKVSIEDYSRIEVKIGNDNIADNEIKLIPSPDSDVGTAIITFRDVSTLEFRFCLFLIYERFCKEEYWLKHLKPSIRKSGTLLEKLKNVFIWCDHPVNEIEAAHIKGWWNDDDKRKEHKRQINKKISKLGIDGNLIKKTPNKYAGSFELNRCIIDACISNIDLKFPDI